MTELSPESYYCYLESCFERLSKEHTPAFKELVEEVYEGAFKCYGNVLTKEMKNRIYREIEWVDGYGLTPSYLTAMDVAEESRLKRIRCTVACSSIRMFVLKLLGVQVRRIKVEGLELPKRTVLFIVEEERVEEVKRIIQAHKYMLGLRFSRCKIGPSIYGERIGRIVVLSKPWYTDTVVH